MRINDYNSLVQAISLYLARSDLNDSVDYLISLAESRITYGSADATYPSPPLRIGAMRKITEGETTVIHRGEAGLTLPAGLIEVCSISLRDGGYSPIALVDSADYLELATQTGRPRVGSIVGDRLLLAPVADRAYSLRLDYFERFQPLDADNNNWLVENIPGLYLYGALLEAEPFLMHDERMMVWAALYSSLVRSVMQGEHSRRFGNRPIESRVKGATP
ncbi:MAG: hypothetical protein ORO03_04420 [Alphaproteobacteria bacterium]|nr:hypothetical protein [Alphaproteobacteria bacterium]